ncbi:MAG TPA: protein-L-isoaspartate(D-aspartate) O-methyltransferase [Acidobacteriaceae bacterium]|nr:protein-L-isoaspartate(D-aspartate) O-methyltransferase [Acidobacteriaceae bacterium]
MRKQHWRTDGERIEAHREFFAQLIARRAGVAPDGALAEAFRSTPRERFVGGPPWRILTSHGFVEAPANDPAFLYQDVVVSLEVGGLNHGEPSLHAMCIATLGPMKGDRIVHVGAGTGYYTTILAKLVGEQGLVDAYEIEPRLLRRAAENLAQLPQVTLHARSGAVGPLPECDVLYVNAGATAPLAVWLDALKVEGRLLFPLTSGDGTGAMLLITRMDGEAYGARFLFPAQFVDCAGARDATGERRLAELFRNRNWNKVKSLHRNDAPGKSCWLAGEGWWLSTGAP